MMTQDLMYALHIPILAMVLHYVFRRIVIQICIADDGRRVMSGVLFGNRVAHCAIRLDMN